jgi:probable HAF family extracellular repeat protein
MYDLGTLGGATSGAYAVSNNGLVVVGWAMIGGGSTDLHAFRWVSGDASGVASNPQMYDLGTLGESQSWAKSLSADGSVAVGVSYESGGINRAFRWVSGATGGVGANPQMYDLGNLGGTNSYANGVSANGSVVVGGAQTVDSYYHAFRWVSGATGGVASNPQMYDLGTWGGGTRSWANGVSADGLVVVGQARDSNSVDHAFRWTQGAGMQSVEEWLQANGVTVSGISTLSANATNANGSVVVGETPTNHPYIARVINSGGNNNGGGTGDGGSNGGTSNGGSSNGGSSNGDGVSNGGGGNGLLVLDENTANSLRSPSTITQTGLLANNLILTGAHSRPLSYRVTAGQNTYWAAGDWGQDNHDVRNGDIGLADLGLGRNFGAIQVNAALGRTWANQNLDLNGNLDDKGSYLFAEAMMPLRGSLWGVLSGYYLRGDTDLRRGYLNAGTLDYSYGHPDTYTWAVRGRLEWDSIASIVGVSLNPYGDLSYTHTRMEGYTETGGGFPAGYDAKTDYATELRIGVNGTKPLTERTKLVGTLEGVHRFEKTSSNVSGEVLGVGGFTFDFPGQSYDQDWLRVGLGAETKIGGGIASLMFNATTVGEIPNAWLAVRYQATF